MRNALSTANKAVQKINEDDTSLRQKWKKDPEHREGGSFVCQRLHNTDENKEVISCTDQTLRIQNQKNSKATNQSRCLPGLIAKIRPVAPLSSNADHLQGLPPVILTYASVLGAAAVMLFIPAEPDFDEDMSREQGLFYF